MTAAVTLADSRALWYMTRGFGLVSLLLLTVTTALGVAQIARYARPGLPRFVIGAVHRNGSLLAVAAIGVHVATAVADSYAPIRVVDVLVPFTSAYRPVWTGFGALALDLLLALVVTSLLRVRLGHRTWRAVHWAAYACWPVALVHGLGTGSDSRAGWVEFIYVACTSVILAAVVWRLSRAWKSERPLGVMASTALAVAVPVIVLAWATSGPLRPGWAKRAGTPAHLLAASAATGSAGAAGTAGGSSTNAPSGSTGPSGASPLPLPLNARFTGTQRVTDSGGDLVIIEIDGSFSGGQLRLVLKGPPAEGGGVDLTSGLLDVGPPGQVSQLSGQVTGLAGPDVVAQVTGSSGTYTADVHLSELSPSGAVRGRLTVRA